MEISVKSRKTVESITVTDGNLTFNGNATMEDGVFTNLTGTIRDTNNNTVTVDCSYSENNAQITVSGSPVLAADFTVTQYIQAIAENFKTK